MKKPVLVVMNSGPKVILKPGTTLSPERKLSVLTELAKCNGFDPDGCTILVLGETGDGKSTTINRLFNSNILPSGNEGSVTKEPNVCNINLLFGITPNNIQSKRLRFIDTPGFLDTDGEDVSHIAVLQEFLSSQKPPDVVIITMKATGVRLGGKASSFAKTLQYIKIFLGAYIDPYSIIIAATHAGGILAGDYNNVCASKEKLVKSQFEAIGWPAPPIVFTENIGTRDASNESVIKMGVDQYVRLPSGEVCPQNIFIALVKSLISRQFLLGAELVGLYYSNKGKTTATAPAIEKIPPHVKESSQSRMPRIASQLIQFTQLSSSTIPRPTEIDNLLDKKCDDGIKDLLYYGYYHSRACFTDVTASELNSSLRGEVPGPTLKLLADLLQLPRGGQSTQAHPMCDHLGVCFDVRRGQRKRQKIIQYFNAIDRIVNKRTFALPEGVRLVEVSRMQFDELSEEKHAVYIASLEPSFASKRSSPESAFSAPPSSKTSFSRIVVRSFYELCAHRWAWTNPEFLNDADTASRKNNFDGFFDKWGTHAISAVNLGEFWV